MGGSNLIDNILKGFLIINSIVMGYYIVNEMYLMSIIQAGMLVFFMYIRATRQT